MRGRLLFVTGVAVGYVLGARAGRKRYEQIASAASRVWESPVVQTQVNKAEDYVAAKIGEIPGALATGVKKIVQSSASRNPGTPQAATGGSAASSPVATPDPAAAVAEARSAGSKASSAAASKAKKTT